MIWVEHLPHLAVMRNDYEGLLRKPERKRLLGRSRLIGRHC